MKKPCEYPHALGQRAAYCTYHRWNLSFRDVQKKGCIDAVKQRGNPACKHLVKDAEHEIWERRKEKNEAKKAKKRIA